MVTPPRALLRRPRCERLDADRLWLGTRATLGWWRGARPARRPGRAGRDHPLPPRPHRRQRGAGRAYRCPGGRPGPGSTGAWLSRPGSRTMPARLSATWPITACRPRWPPSRRTPRAAPPSTRPSRPCWLSEGDTIELGGEPYRVLELPGHADGAHRAARASQPPAVRRRRAAGRDHAHVRRWPGYRGRPTGSAATWRRWGGYPDARDRLRLWPGDRRRGSPRRRDRRPPPSAAGRYRGRPRRGSRDRVRGGPADLGRRAARLPRTALRTGRGDLLQRLEATDRAVQRTPRRWQPIGV